MSVYLFIPFPFLEKKEKKGDCQAVKCKMLSKDHVFLRIFLCPEKHKSNMHELRIKFRCVNKENLEDLSLLFLFFKSLGRDEKYQGNTERNLENSHYWRRRRLSRREQRRKKMAQVEGREEGTSLGKRAREELGKKKRGGNWISVKEVQGWVCMGSQSGSNRRTSEERRRAAWETKFLKRRGKKIREIEGPSFSIFVSSPSQEKAISWWWWREERVWREQDRHLSSKGFGATRGIRGTSFFFSLPSRSIATVNTSLS